MSVDAIGGSLAVDGLFWGCAVKYNVDSRIFITPDGLCSPMVVALRHLSSDNSLFFCDGTVAV